MVYRSNLQDTRAAVRPPPPLHLSLPTLQVSLLVKTKPWPALAPALSGLALTQILWLTLQTCGQVGHGRPSTLSGVGVGMGWMEKQKERGEEKQDTGLAQHLTVIKKKKICAVKTCAQIMNKQAATPPSAS